jgi:tryptophanyl-tRNA synthetase
VFDLHRVFSSEETQQTAAHGCRAAGIGCIECKQWLADGVVAALAPIQERRRKFESNPKLVDEILDTGGRRAWKRADETIRQVSEVMGLRYRSTAR